MGTLLNKFDAWLDRHFFRPTDARSLSLFRFLFCLAIAAHIVYHADSAMRQHQSVAWSPIPLFEKLGIGLMSYGAFQTWCAILIVSLILTAIGAFTRLSATIAWIAYFAYVGTHLGFSKTPDTNYVSHSKNIVVFVLFILSVAPGVGRWGIDDFIARGWKSMVQDLSDRNISAWPIQLIILMLSLAYFGAGYTKVKASPLWADGYTMQAYLLMKYLLLDTEPGFWIARSYWLCLALGIATLVFELTFVLAVFYPRLRWFYVPSGILFHSMTALTMQIHFVPFRYVYLIFLDWPFFTRLKSSVARFFRRETAGQSTSKAIRPQKEGHPGEPILDLPSYRWGQSVVLGMATVQLLCVFGKVESWPFTDYRVFEGRNHMDRVKVLRVAGVTVDGRTEFLDSQDYPTNPVAINRRIRVQLNKNEIDAARQVLQEIAIKAESRRPGRFNSLQLMERTVSGNARRGEFQIHDSCIAQLTMNQEPQFDPAYRSATAETIERHIQTRWE